MENKIADFNTLSSPNFLGSSILKLKIEPFVFLAIFLTVNRQSFLHLLLKGLIVGRGWIMKINVHLCITLAALFLHIIWLWTNGKVYEILLHMLTKYWMRNPPKKFWQIVCETYDLDKGLQVAFNSRVCIQRSWWISWFIESWEFHWIDKVLGRL